MASYGYIPCHAPGCTNKGDTRSMAWCPVCQQTYCRFDAVGRELWQPVYRDSQRRHFLYWEARCLRHANSAA